VRSHCNNYKNYDLGNKMVNDRYAVAENEDYEPESNQLVLKNFLAIKDSQTIEILEERELKRTGIELTELYNKAHQFTSQDICDIHALWLAGIYPFAGQYRTSNMSKGGYQFAAAHLIGKLIRDLEKNHLSKYTPCNYIDDESLAEALAIIHVEFIIIHPFREGNGRVARLIANLMALQADRPFLNYAPIDRTIHPKGFEHYISAIHQGHCGNYRIMQSIFIELLNASKNYEA
jgi:cell filamentation protein